MQDNKFHYKGIYLWPLGGNWVPKIPFGCTQECLGYYDSPHHAALAYNFGLEMMDNKTAEKNLIHPSFMPKKAIQDEIRAAVAISLDRLVKKATQDLAPVDAETL